MGTTVTAIRGGVRGQGRRVLTSLPPVVADKLRGSVAAKRSAADELRLTRRQVTRLRARVVALEEEVQENRQLNRRLAELTDVVQELLVPMSQRDEAKVRKTIERYSSTL